MNCFTLKDRINTVNEDVKETSFMVKTNIKSEDEINKFLDGINSVRQDLLSRTGKLNSIITSLESLTWIDEEMDEDCLRKVNELIASSRDLHSALIKDYVSYLNPLKARGICNTEIKNYKQALDAFKEVYSDMESVFFFLPKDAEFLSLTDRLNATK